MARELPSTSRLLHRFWRWSTRWIVTRSWCGSGPSSRGWQSDGMCRCDRWWEQQQCGSSWQSRGKMLSGLVAIVATDSGGSRPWRVQQILPYQAARILPMPWSKRSRQGEDSPGRWQQVAGSTAARSPGFGSPHPGSTSPFRWRLFGWRSMHHRLLRIRCTVWPLPVVSIGPGTAGPHHYQRASTLCQPPIGISDHRDGTWRRSILWSDCRGSRFSETMGRR